MVTPEDDRNEAEAALAICSKRAEEIADEIASQTSLAGYRLVRHNEISLRDTYWDLPSGELGANRFALRLRAIETDIFIALKGPTKVGNDGVPTRLELESPWSEEALEETLESLRWAGVDIPPDPGGQDNQRPHEILKSLGFKKVQDRETRRRARDLVVEAAADGPTVAELAIDVVRYRIKGRTAIHHEVEIEAKGKARRDVIPRTLEALNQKYGWELRNWNYGKLPTGKVIVGLMKDDQLADKIGPGGELLPAAYDLIAAELAKEPAPRSTFR